MSEPVNRQRMVLMLAAAGLLGGLLFLDQYESGEEVTAVGRAPPPGSDRSSSPASAAIGAGPGGLSTTRRSQNGNPLADLSVAQLTATVESPLFRRTRLPPAPPPPPAAVTEEAPPSPPPKAAEPPPLELLGLAVEDDRRIALVKLKPKGELRRLRQGETLEGWTVRAIRDRSLVLEQGGRQEILELFAAKPL